MNNAHLTELPARDRALLLPFATVTREHVVDTGVGSCVAAREPAENIGCVVGLVFLEFVLGVFFGLKLREIVSRERACQGRQVRGEGQRTVRSRSLLASRSAF